MKRAIPRIPSCRLPIGKSREIARQSCCGPRAANHCCLQLANVDHLFLATCNERLVYLPSKAKRFRNRITGTRVAHSLKQDSTFRSDQMADAIFIIISVVFFVISWFYVRGCDRL
jgi:hypothetical protein